MERRVKKMLQYVEVSEKVAGGGVVFASSASGSGSGSSSGKGLLPPSDSGSGGGSDLIPGEPIYVRYINGIMGGLPMVKRGNEYYFLDGDKLGGLVGAIEPGGVVQVGTVPVVPSGGSNGDTTGSGVTSGGNSTSSSSSVSGSSSGSGVSGRNNEPPMPDDDLMSPFQSYDPYRARWVDNGVTQTSDFGMRDGEWHYGDDYRAPEGTPLYAQAGGEVVGVGWDNLGGYFLRVEYTIEVSPGRRITFQVGYMHLREQPNYRAGDRLIQSQLLGYSGNTGSSRGAHLHMELRVSRNDTLAIQYFDSLVALPQDRQTRDNGYIYYDPSVIMGHFGVGVSYADNGRER